MMGDKWREKGLVMLRNCNLRPTVLLREKKKKSLENHFSVTGLDNKICGSFGYKLDSEAFLIYAYTVLWKMFPLFQFSAGFICHT